MFVRILMLLLVSACASTADRSVPVSESYVVPAGSIVLRVRATKVEATDYFPGECDPDELCVPQRFWHRYRADVIEVLRGEWGEAAVLFGNVQHAHFSDAVVRDFYVVLLPASDDVRDKVGVPFVVDRLFSHRFDRDAPIIRAIRAGGCLHMRQRIKWNLVAECAGTGFAHHIL